MALFGKDDRMQRPEDARPFVVGGPTHSSEAPTGDVAWRRRTSARAVGWKGS